MTEITLSRTTVPTDSTAAIIALVGRLLIAAIFLLSGFGKAADPTGTIGYIASAGLPLPQLGLAVALAVELVGGFLLVIGYRTRVNAAALAAFTMAAGFGFHFDLADQNQVIHFLKNLAIAGGLAQLVALGGGKFSLDTNR